MLVLWLHPLSLLILVRLRRSKGSWKRNLIFWNFGKVICAFLASRRTVSNQVYLSSAYCLVVPWSVILLALLLSFLSFVLLLLFLYKWSLDYCLFLVSVGSLKLRFFDDRVGSEFLAKVSFKLFERFLGRPRFNIFHGRLGFFALVGRTLVLRFSILLLTLRFLSIYSLISLNFAIMITVVIRTFCGHSLLLALFQSLIQNLYLRVRAFS